MSLPFFLYFMCSRLFASDYTEKTVTAAGEEYHDVDHVRDAKKTLRNGSDLKLSWMKFLIRELTVDQSILVRLKS